MRVVTYNIHGWQTITNLPNYSLVAEVLDLADADVIGLNEVYHPASVATGSALGWLASELGMFYVFAACEARKIPGTPTPVSYGNALLSRMPLASTSSGLFSALPGKEQRGYLEGRIDVGNGQIFTVIVTHLDHTDEHARLTQIEDLFNSVGRVAGMPDLIMGDFNCVHPRDYVNRPDAFVRLSSHSLASHMANQPEGLRVAGHMEERGYTEALIHNECLGNGTFIPAADPVRLDYIWLSSEMLPALARVGIFEHPNGQEASDHRAVFAELFSP